METSTPTPTHNTDNRRMLFQALGFDTQTFASAAGARQAKDNPHIAPHCSVAVILESTCSDVRYVVSSVCGFGAMHIFGFDPEGQTVTTHDHAQEVA